MKKDDTYMLKEQTGMMDWVDGNSRRHMVKIELKAIDHTNMDAVVALEVSDS